MAKNDQQEAYEKLLTNLLQRILDNQKYAETKNAALLTFCSAWILAALSQTGKENELPAEFYKAILIAVPFFIGGAAVAVVSFLPKLNRFRLTAGNATKSLVYFGDIAEMALNEYTAGVRKRYYPDDGNSTTEEYMKALESQIWINSGITRRKHLLFIRGAVVTGIGVLVLIMPLVMRLANWLLSLVLQVAANTPAGG